MTSRSVRMLICLETTSTNLQIKLKFSTVVPAWMKMANSKYTSPRRKITRELFPAL